MDFVSILPYFLLVMTYYNGSYRETFGRYLNFCICSACSLHSSQAVQVAASPSVPRRSPYQQRPGRKAKFGGALGSKNPHGACLQIGGICKLDDLTACATMCHQLTMQKTMPSHTPQKTNSKLGIRPTGYQLSLTPGRSSHIPSPVHARDVHICAKPMPQHCSNYSFLCLPASSADMKLSRMRSFRMVSSFWPVLRQFLFWHGLAPPAF